MGIFVSSQNQRFYFAVMDHKYGIFRCLIQQTSQRDYPPKTFLEAPSSSKLSLNTVNCEWNAFRVKGTNNDAGNVCCFDRRNPREEV